ncbi:hypothetical protein ACF065_35105 [Streptomyces sp. NPDC015232]|uniref:hypothetical protein n=1 Tax=unclassified Streptomyces TaxID=2593676 RepID=UPI0036F9773E
MKQSRTTNDSPPCTPTSSPYEFMRGIGNLCIGQHTEPRYDSRRLIELLIDGPRQQHPDGSDA